MDWLFDTPWWLPLALVLVGGFILVAGNRRQDKSIMRTAALILLAAVALLLTSWLVDTDIEKAEKRTRSIAAAVNDRDWVRLRSLLDPETSFSTVYHNRDQIVSGGQATAERIGVKNVRIISMESNRAGTVITVDVAALSEQDLYPGNTPTNWRFTYDNLGTGWRLANIEPLPNLVITPDIIRNQLSRPR